MWKKYTPEDFEAWNKFVKENSHHFMFMRSYMDYHSDRFDDFSLIFEEENEIKFICPGSIKNNMLFSHGGLTFGGLLPSKSSKNDIFNWLAHLDSLKIFLESQNIDQFIYKPVPYIYSHQSNLCEKIALVNSGFKLETCGISMTIDLSQPFSYSSRRKRMIKKAKNLSYLETPIKKFYPILEELLESKYQTNPVHSEEELISLSEKHPNNIKCYCAIDDQENILSGVILFITDKVAHLQYIATSDDGRNIGALDGLTNYLIEIFKSTHKYFDFGTSMNRDESINLGLLKQKSEFGSQPTSYEMYLLKVEG